MFPKKKKKKKNLTGRKPIRVQGSLGFKSVSTNGRPSRLTRKPRRCTCGTKVLMQCPVKVAHHIRAQMGWGAGQVGCLWYFGVPVCVNRVCVLRGVKQGVLGNYAIISTKKSPGEEESHTKSLCITYLLLLTLLKNTHTHWLSLAHKETDRDRHARTHAHTSTHTRSSCHCEIGCFTSTFKKRKKKQKTPQW